MAPDHISLLTYRYMWLPEKKLHWVIIYNDFKNILRQGLVANVKYFDELCHNDECSMVLFKVLTVIGISHRYKQL